MFKCYFSKRLPLRLYVGNVYNLPRKRGVVQPLRHSASYAPAIFSLNIANLTENLELKSCQLFQILKNDTFCAANDNGIPSV